MMSHSSSLASVCSLRPDAQVDPKGEHAGERPQIDSDIRAILKAPRPEQGAVVIPLLPRIRQRSYRRFAPQGVYGKTPRWIVSPERTAARGLSPEPRPVMRSPLPVALRELGFAVAMLSAGLTGSWLQGRALNHWAEANLAELRLPESRTFEPLGITRPVLGSPLHEGLVLDLHDRF